jgi:hypothetical protein
MRVPIVLTVLESSILSVSRIVPYVFNLAAAFDQVVHLCASFGAVMEDGVFEAGATRATKPG